MINKRGQEVVHNTLIEVLIAAALLAVVFIAIYFMTGAGNNMLDKIRTVFSGGGLG